MNVCFVLAAVPLASRGFVFKDVGRGKKNKLKKCKVLNLKIKQLIPTILKFTKKKNLPNQFISY